MYMEWGPLSLMSTTEELLGRTGILFMYLYISECVAENHMAEHSFWMELFSALSQMSLPIRK
jgi:hypothetical protein